MSEFNFKNFKPTQQTPSKLGKKIDSGFNKQMRNAGVNMNTIHENDDNQNKEDKASLKKKIFNLAKMETLIATDDYLGSIYEKMKVSGAETYGYHYNETLNNIIFNDYVLNDAAYLQKYKNTKTINKKRRGEEGTEELEKAVQSKIDSNNTDDKSFNRTKKIGDINTDNDIPSKMKKVSSDVDNEVNELFGFGKPEVPLMTHKASKNDTYYVDKNTNTVVGVLSHNLSQEQNSQTAQKFADTLKYERMPWYVTVQNKVKGVPTEVSDGSIQDFASDELKYAGVPSLAENDDVNETTTSASSGAFVGPFGTHRVKALDTPLWKGGTILKESVLSDESKTNYLVNPEGFIKYVNLVENTLQLENIIGEDGGTSIKQHAESILRQLQRMAGENPELNQMPEYKEILDIYSKRATTGKVENEPQQQSQQIQQPVDNTNQFKQQPIGMTENEFAKNFVDAMKGDLSNTKDSKSSVSKMSPDKLEDNDGLFKDKWSEDESSDYGKVSDKNPIGKQPGTVVDEKSESKSQQRFMGMVHAAQKGKLDMNKVKNPEKIEKAASTMSDKDVEDFASTKHSGLPEKVKEDNTMTAPSEVDNGNVLIELGKLLFPDSGKSAEELKSLAQDILKNFFNGKSPQDALNLIKTKLSDMNLTEEKDNKFNPEDYTKFFKEKLKASGKDFKVMNQDERKAFLNQVDAEFKEHNKNGVKEGILDDQPDSMVNTSDSSMAHTMDSDDSNTSGTPMDGTDSSETIPPISENKKWEQDAVKDKGGLHKKLGISSDKKIPIEKINSEITKLDKKHKNGEKMSDEDNHFKKMLTLAKTFKKQNMSEERMSPSMINKEKINKETAILTQKDMANADALKQAEVYPNPKEFYIEQDLDKVQKDAKSGEDLEREALAKVTNKDESFKNDGDSTNENGNEIPKRNLTKDEMLKLAMNRGDGMHNIVYDNKPSDKFEKRLEKDMGEDQYKLRQEKMKFRKDMPMYNKDTQPTEKGNSAEQDNKFKEGFNEAFTGKYVDDYGRIKLVEFEISNVFEIDVPKGYQINIEGLGNKYTQKINESTNYSNEISQYDFYLFENTVFKFKKIIEEPKEVISEEYKRMQKLMGYNTNDFVNTKKSVKF